MSTSLVDWFLASTWTSSPGDTRGTDAASSGSIAPLGCRLIRNSTLTSSGR